MIYDKVDEVIEEHFESVLKRYRFGLEILTNGSDFILDCVELLYQKWHKINLNHGRSYTDSLNLIKNK